MPISWLVPALLALLALLSALGGCSVPASPAGNQTQTAVTRPAQIDTATAQTSQQGRYRISYTPDAEPITINTLHAWTVHVATVDDQPVPDATVSVAGGMPEHNHGMLTQPQVTPAGGAETGCGSGRPGTAARRYTVPVKRPLLGQRFNPAKGC